MEFTEYMIRNEIPGSCVSFTFNLLRNTNWFPQSVQRKLNLRDEQYGAQMCNTKERNQTSRKKKMVCSHSYVDSNRCIYISKFTCGYSTTLREQESLNAMRWGCGNGH